MHPFSQIPHSEVDKEAVNRLGFWEFVRLSWDHIKPESLIESWHLKEIAAHLEAVSRGECRRLIITIPPGCTKSTMVSVLWPAWDWTQRPGRQWMFATFDQDLAFRDAVDCRSLVRSEWYKQRWGERVQIASSGDQRETMSIYNTTKGGRRLSVTVSGKGLGWHANIQVVDDPTNPKDIRSGGDVARAALERTWHWWTGTMASRKSDPKTFSRVIIQQRLHEDDLVGRILNSANAEEWTLLCLPMEFEKDRACVTPWGGDRRTEDGELLCPERFDSAAVLETKREMTPQVVAAQLQQRPAPAGGNIFLREWFKERWTVEPDKEGMVLVQSWDCTFKGGPSSDFVAGHLWGYKDGKYYLLDRIHDRMGFPETCSCILSWCKKWPMAFAKLIENAANGPAIEQTLKDRVTGIILVKPQDIGGSKEARANAIAPLAQAGNIILPDPSVHPWSDEVLEEMVNFPMARNDDDVDASTMAILHLHGRSNSRYLSAMAKIAKGDVPHFFRRTA